MKIRKTHIILPIVVGALTPSIAIFLLQVVVRHVPPIHSIGYIARQFAEGSSLLPVMAHCMIPFVLLIGITLLQARKVDIVPLNFRFYGGLLGIFIYMMYTQISIMLPFYNGEKKGFMFVPELILLPFTCIVTMGIGMLVGWLVHVLCGTRPQRSGS